MSLEAFAEMSGQSMSLMAALVYPAHQRWGAHITLESLQRILEVEFDLDALPSHRRIDSAGTARRLQGLAVMGVAPVLARGSARGVRPGGGLLPDASHQHRPDGAGLQGPVRPVVAAARPVGAHHPRRAANRLGVPTGLG